MPASRVRGALLLAGLAVVYPVLGQEIPNWPAPLLWSPPAAGTATPEGGLAKAGVPTPALPFVGITPCRLVDTRPSQGFPPAWGLPALVANATRDFDLNSAPHCSGVPANAEAYSLNVTVTETLGAGDIRMWPTGTPPLVVSTQNWPAAGVTLANAAIVPAGTGGSITVQVAGSDTHVIVDINGYYAGSVQARILGTCPDGSSIRIVNPDGSVVCETDDVGTASAWTLTGNAATVPGANFLGTTDNQALEIKVNAARVFRFGPDATSPVLIGGSPDNFVLPAVPGATISGGGAAGLANRVTDNFGTIGGGRNNQAGDNAGTTSDMAGATVGGGFANTASGLYSTVAGGVGSDAQGQSATVGGGDANLASGTASTIGGGGGNIASALRTAIGGGGFNQATAAGASIFAGSNNVASGVSSWIGGGSTNIASGPGAVVPGGALNVAAGAHSFAAGRQAKANHDGAWVWGSHVLVDIASTGPHQFIVRSPGGIWLGTTDAPSIPVDDFLNTSTGAHLTTAGVWTNNSDRTAKENFDAIDTKQLLSKLAKLPITSWNYKIDGDALRHIGPTAQDFHTAFGLGNDDRSIGTLDADGVALAAIQGLYQLLCEKEDRIRTLEERLTALETRLSD